MRNFGTFGVQNVTTSRICGHIEANDESASSPWPTKRAHENPQDRKENPGRLRCVDRYRKRHAIGSSCDVRGDR